MPEQEKQIPIYRDIAERTQGDVYIGVVGPVRTGKSTLIARVLEALALPAAAPGPKRERLMDELPQSATGRTITTTEPKFVPSEAANIELDGGVRFKLRMVDSVGFLVDGALGTEENGAARMVRTPWHTGDVPFEEAALTGTRRVMRDHSTLGLVVTTDGSFTELPRAAYADAEEKVVREMKALGKPFVIALNTKQPEHAHTRELAQTLSEKYDAPVSAMDAMNLSERDIRALLSKALGEFPLREVFLSPPEWLLALDNDHWLMANALTMAREQGAALRRVRDAEVFARAFDQNEWFSPLTGADTALGEGTASFRLPTREGLFNRVLGEQCGQEIQGDAHLLMLMKQLVSAKTGYDRVSEALDAAQQTGYGMVAPSMDEITLGEPEIIRQGSRFGVRLRASAPALHVIRSDIETEVNPVVGTEEQTEQFAKFMMREFELDPQRIWNTNFFGKSLMELVREGLGGKLSRIPPEVQEKVQAALGKMINEGSGGMICILL